MSKIKFPFGAADTVAKAYAATVSATIDNMCTVLTVAQMTGAATLNLTLDTNLEVGAVLYVKTSADGTNRVITWGTGMTGNAYTNTASKSVIHKFVYDGSTFNLVSSNQLN